MEDWNPNYNWTYEEFVQYLEEPNEDVVYFNAEHSDWGNLNAMVQWAKDLGYRAEISPNLEIVKVFKN